MMKAVELSGSNAPPEQDVASMIEMNARAFGFPSSLSQVVLKSFDGNASTYMTNHFKTHLPVIGLVLHRQTKRI